MNSLIECVCVCACVFVAVCLCTPGIGLGLGEYLKLSTIPAKHLSHTHKYTHTLVCALAIASWCAHLSSAYHTLCLSVCLPASHSHLNILWHAQKSWHLCLQGHIYTFSHTPVVTFGGYFVYHSLHPSFKQLLSHIFQDCLCLIVKGVHVMCGLCILLFFIK